MYEQTFSHEVVREFEQQQRERSIERRRFVRDHADQIVPRPVGVIGRMLGRRARGRVTDAAPAARVADAAPAPRGATTPREPAPAR